MNYYNTDIHFKFELLKRNIFRLTLVLSQDMDKNYKLLEDYDKKNLFYIENYMKRKGKAKLNRNMTIARL